MLCGSRRCRSWRFLLLGALLQGLLPFAAQGAAVVVEARVATSSDDAEQKVGSTSVSLTSSDLELVTDGSAQTVGMRFAGLGIPRGAVITDAWLQFQVDEATIAAAALTIRAQAADNAPSFSTASNDVAGRATGSAAVAWMPAPWPTVGAAGVDQRAQGLAPLIQQVVSRSGWTYGNALVLLLTGSGVRTAEAFDGSSSAAPLLHVVFESSGADFPPSVTLGSPADHAMFGLGQAVSFSATASDAESGNVTASLSWTSSRDGALGTGGSFVRSNLSAGTHTISVTARDAGGQTATRSFAIQVVSGYHVLVGAGDISECTNDHDGETARVLDQTFGTVVTLGDNVYPDGTLTEFQTCYGPSWGRHKARTRPSPGNHDFDTSNAAGYFGYFGAAAGPAPNGYYSFEAGAWHVVVLNSECGHVAGGCARSSPQGQWLAADLAAHPNLCTLAIMHRPRFGSSGTGDEISMLDFWQLLYEAGADVVLAGHQHNYERFDPQSPTGQADPARGIREFVVGTGGAGLGTPGLPHPNSVVQSGSSYGVLKLTLYASSYDWQFLPVAGSSFTDSGSASCVNAGPVNGIPTVDIGAPSEGTTFPVNTAVTFSATASDAEDGDLTAGIRWTSDRSGLIGIGGTLVTSALPGGAHRVTASSTDGAGGVGTDVVSITIYEPGLSTTQKRVVAGPDDAEERVSDGRISLDSSDLELTYDGRDQVVGLRFTGVPVPRGAAIVDAWVQFQADEVSTGATTLSLRAEASDDAAPFSTVTRNVSLRPRTTAAVSWSPADWPTVGAAGAAQRTPGLTSVIQQVVDRAGWASGNDLVLIITGSGLRVAESFEGGAAKAPLLVIQYDAP
jgi:hypothetical protein